MDMLVLVESGNKRSLLEIATYKRNSCIIQTFSAAPAY